MVMLWEKIKESSANKREFRRPNTAEVPEDRFERLEIRDYDLGSGDSATWHAEVQLRELFKNLPVESRIEPDWMLWRKTWGMVGFFMMFLFSYGGGAMVIGPVHPIFPAFTLALFVGSFCWWKGADWCPTPPFWVARRIWVDSVPHMQPIVHTLLQGEIPFDSMAVMPAPTKKNTNGHAPEQDDDTGSVVEVGGPEGRTGGIQVAGFEPPPEGTYVPVTPRATTLYQDLQMAEERQEMRVPRDKWSKLALGGLVLFAGIMIIGLIFVMAVTSNNG